MPYVFFLWDTFRHCLRPREVEELVACRFYFSYNIANYMSGLGSASLFHFDLFANFFIILLVDWLWWFWSACNVSGIGWEQGVGKWILDRT